MRSKLPLPRAIANAPQLEWDLELYWEAYTDLSTCRPASFSSVLPLPWTAVVDYAAVNGFDYEQTQSLVFFCRRMDNEFLKWHERSGGNKV
jgi:hypothetical protein